MNLENKKQIAIVLLAVGLGLVAAIATGKYIETSVNQKAQAYKKAFEKDFEKKAMVPLLGEIGKLQKDLKKLKTSQAMIMKKQQQQAKQIAKGPKPVVNPYDPKKIVDSTVFSVITPPGKRAITIKINTLSAVGGLINPGDFVDIIAQLSVPIQYGENTKEKITSVFFQNLQVLAVGTNFKPVGNALVYQAQQKSRALNVTLALTPEEAGLLTFAQANGKLNLSLRSPKEKGKKVLQIASWDTLSEYVLENQGTELLAPEKKEVYIEEKEAVKTAPSIRIFRSGREL